VASIVSVATTPKVEDKNADMETSEADNDAVGSGHGNTPGLPQNAGVNGSDTLLSRQFTEPCVTVAAGRAGFGAEVVSLVHAARHFRQMGKSVVWDFSSATATCLCKDDAAAAAVNGMAHAGSAVAAAARRLLASASYSSPTSKKHTHGSGGGYGKAASSPSKHHTGAKVESLDDATAEAVASSAAAVAKKVKKVISVSKKNVVDDDDDAKEPTTGGVSSSSSSSAGVRREGDKKDTDTGVVAKGETKGDESTKEENSTALAGKIGGVTAPCDEDDNNGWSAMFASTSVFLPSKERALAKISAEVGGR
jgi:hypothetical protein